ncbi:MAG: RNA polymerase sigma factor [Oscillospiraceae bacterium]
MEDTEIIALYEMRNENALVQTGQKYTAYCMHISMNILGNREDAEECVNDAYLHAWNAIPPEHPRMLSTYLGRLTRNVSIDRYKLQTAQKRGGGTMELLLSELEDCIPDTCSVEDAAENREITALIEAFLKASAYEKRVTFVRRYFYGDSVREVAQHFGWSEGKVKSLLFYTRKELRNYLEREEAPL